ncbi:MAG: hypothetical protein KIT45_13805 [Fimbriimonadia bacterium]|nr:hypothetical protein [Fimbriimonadia bacterium]
MNIVNERNENCISFFWYNESSDYGWLPGHWLSALDPPGEGAMFYQDRFGVQVAGDFNPLQPSDELPEYIADQLQNLLSQYLSGSRSLVGVVAEIGGNDFSMDIINEMLNPPKPILLPPGPPLPPSSRSNVGSSDGARGLGFGQLGGSTGGGSFESVPPWLIGVILVSLESSYSSRGGLCNYICEYEFPAKPLNSYCKNLCSMVSEKGCDWLFAHCNRLPGTGTREVCMTVYLAVCNGR